MSHSIPSTPSVHEHPYSSFLKQVKKPAQYVGGEMGSTPKAWDRVDVRMCLAFPDLYEVGMSHLGFRILYSLLNQDPRFLAERAYAPWLDMEQALREHGQPLLSLESWRPLSDFDVVGFSLQFELTYTNVLLMMDLGGIPLRSADRTDAHPLVLCGGPVATHPEPIAPFVDAFVIGDGEQCTPDILTSWSNTRGQPRAQRIRALSQIQGVYVPALYVTEEQADTGFHVVAAPVGSRDGTIPFPVERTFVQDLEEYPFPSDGPVAVTETVFDRVSVEVARGCTEGCRFCQAGMIYRPVRERSPAQILNVIDQSVNCNGYDEASLTSLSTADYSAVAPLVGELTERLQKEQVSLSVSSLRAYGLDEAVLDDLRKTNTGGLTFAPEAGTQRMRDVVNKNVTEEQLLETAHRVFSRGWQKMKLYFMIGLPTEEEEDVRGIVQTGARALQVARTLKKNNTTVTVSVSTHVPKPHTPFQWCAMDDHETVRTKQSMLRNEVYHSGFKARLKLRTHNPEGSWIEGVLARGDRTMANVLETAYLNGARFDSWQEHLKLDVWRNAFTEHDVDPARYLGTIPIDARLPWDHIDVGLEEDFLAREYKKSLRNRLSPPCGKAAGDFVHATHLAQANADSRKLVCYDCGIACDMGKMRSQRKDFLVQLGAEQPRVHPAEVPVKTPVGLPAAVPAAALAELPAEVPGALQAETSGEPRPKTMKPKGSKKHPIPQWDQGDPIRLRLRYTRLGRASFSSHLDLIRLLPRILRRAELPVFYSQGYHPKPAMTFGLSLPVGTASLAELVDVKLQHNRLPTEDVDRILTQLNGATVEGIQFLAARFLKPGEKGLGHVANTLDLVAGIPKKFLHESQLDENSLAQLIARGAQQPNTIDRKVKDATRTVQVANYLKDIHVGDKSQALDTAGALGDFVPVTMTVRMDPTGTARPGEVLESVTQGKITRHQIGPLVRTNIYFTHPDSGEHNDPLQPLNLQNSPEA